MFPITPEQRLWLVKQRQAELIEDTARERLVSPGRGHSANRHWSRRLAAVPRALENRIASVGGALLHRDTGPNEPCCDNAVG
jgi:hypothetical protein